MINLYVSLVSSLPLLRMTETPAVSYSKFMSDCSGLLDDKHFGMLRRFSLVPGLRPGQKPQDGAQDTPDALESFIAEFPKNSLAWEYLRFETALRHSAMKIRAAKLGASFAAPKPGHVFFDPEADRMVRAAFAAPNPVERERILDAARWDKLDELEVKNRTRFNFDTVCAYSIRIQIAEKWAARSAGNSAEGLDRTVSSVLAGDPGAQN